MVNSINVRDVAVRCLRDEADAILNIIPQLDDEFDRVVELIAQCQGKVIVTGVGKSGHVAAKVAATLASTGTPSFYLNPLDAFHGDLGMISTSDIVIALSNSGNTDELLRIIPSLSERKITLIGVSGNADSLLARHSDHHVLLHVPHEACPLNLAPTSSTTAQMALGDALAIALMEVRHFKARDYAQFHPGGSLGRRLLTTARDVMRTEDLPVCSTSTPLSEAVILVSRSRLGLVVPVTADGRVAGIITDGDVRRAMERLQDRFFSVNVSDVMTTSPKCVREDMKINEIQQLMFRCKIHAVLVTDEEHHLIGIVDSFSCVV
ncbi:MAG: KpsF/GutQ family sugar-phosphate isomerase [Bacteroidaceae bacterium]|nr:KpsF/GutQ family sugar-phosphate isomerase [Bacteroidaceae bacterium]